jgi:sec-independent protein translocase protein TatC
VSADEDEIEASRAPLMEHLVELRSRLIVCAWAIGLGFVVCFYFSKDIYLFLLGPFEKASELWAMQQKSPVSHESFWVMIKGLFGQGPPSAHAGQSNSFDMIMVLLGFKAGPAVHVAPVNMVFTEPLEFFFTKVKLAGFGAIVITFPVLAWQLYRFVAPGLYKRERNAFLPFLTASPVLFLMGAALVYFIMLPFVLWFSLNQQIVGSAAVSVSLLPKVSDYLSLVTTLLLAFGLCFQLPVILALLGLAGIVSSKMLSGARRYAIVGVFAVAAVLTPPDPVSMMSLAIPGVLLFEISIWCVWLIERRRAREDAAAELPS